MRLNKVLIIGLFLLLALPLVSAGAYNKYTLANYWSFNENTGATAVDTVSANTMLAVNAWNTTCILGACVNSTTTGTTISTNNLAITGGASRSWSFWTYKGQSSSNVYFMGTGAASGSNALGYRFQTTSEAYTWTAYAQEQASYFPSYSKVWTYHVMTYNATDGTYGTIRLYVNGTLQSTKVLTASLATTADKLYPFTDWDGATRTNNLLLDEVIISGQVFSSSDISTAYTEYIAGINPLNTTSSITNVSVTVNDFYTNSALTNFSIYAVNASGYQYNRTTTNGTANLDIYTNSTQLWNITINSTENGGYFNKTLLNQNVSSTIATTLAQSAINFLGYEKVSSNLISGINAYTSYATNATHYMRVQPYNVTGFKAGYYNSTLAYTPTALTSTNAAITGLYSAILNVSAINNITSAALSNFGYNISSLSYSWSESGTASGTTALIGLINGSYSITISPTGYAPLTFNVTISSNLVTNVSYGFYAANSIFFNIYNSTSLKLINQTVNIQLTGAATYINSTTNGTIFMYGLSPGAYNVTLSSTGFQTSSYTVTVGNNSYQALNVYLDSSTANTVVFTVYNDQTSVPIQNAQVNIEKSINGTYYLTNVISSDISGRVQITYETGATYRFTVANSGFVTKTFVLSPIIFTSYDVRLTPGASGSIPGAFAGMTITMSPTTYYNNATNNFTITLASVSGVIQLFNFTIVTPDNITRSNSSSNAYGDTLTATVPIANASSTDKVYVYYQYIMTDGTSYAFVNIYSINGLSSNGTFAGLSNNQFNLALFDRMIIVFLVTSIVAGLGMTMGGLAVGGFMGIGVLAYFGAVGFVSWWFLAVPIIMIIVLITMGSR